MKLISELNRIDTLILCCKESGIDADKCSEMVVHLMPHNPPKETIADCMLAANKLNAKDKALGAYGLAVAKYTTKALEK